MIDGGIGEASAVKMGYACLTKGTQAIGAVDDARRDAQQRLADGVREALADSLPEVLGYVRKQMPRMFPKAYRWVAEMEEISKFLAADPGASQMLAGAARLYEQIAARFRRPQRGRRGRHDRGFPQALSPKHHRRILRLNDPRQYAGAAKLSEYKYLVYRTHRWYICSEYRQIG